MKTKTSVIGA